MVDGCHGPTEHIVCQVCTSLTQRCCRRETCKPAHRRETSGDLIDLNYQLTLPSPTHRDIPVRFGDPCLITNARSTRQSPKTKPSPKPPSVQALERDGILNRRWVYPTGYPLCCPRILSALQVTPFSRARELADSYDAANCTLDLDAVED